MRRWKAALVTGIVLTGTLVAEPATSSPVRAYSLAFHSQHNLYLGSQGDPTAAISVTPAAKPAAPTGLTVQPGNERLVITFAPGSDNGDAVTRYDISTNGGDTWQSLATTAGDNGTRTGTISALQNGTSYTVRVRAVNTVGTGAISTSMSGIPTPGAPSAPLSLIATAGNGSASLSFAPPTSSGGSPVTGYEVSLDGGDTWQAVTVTGSGQRLTANLPNLINGISYGVKLRARNVTGPGPGPGLVASASVTPVRIDLQLNRSTGASLAGS